MRQQTLSFEERLDVQAEILRHLWYEGHATPARLAGVLGQSRPSLYEGLDELLNNGVIFQFLRSPKGRDVSVYCLTRKTRSRIEKLLQGYSRYRLKSVWNALKREQFHWLAYPEPQSHSR